MDLKTELEFSYSEVFETLEHISKKQKTYHEWKLLHKVQGHPFDETHNYMPVSCHQSHLLDSVRKSLKHLFSYEYTLYSNYVSQNIDQRMDLLRRSDIEVTTDNIFDTLLDNGAIPASGMAFYLQYEIVRLVARLSHHFHNNGDTYSDLSDDGCNVIEYDDLCHITNQMSYDLNKYTSNGSVYRESLNEFKVKVISIATLIGECKGDNLFIDFVNRLQKAA